MNPIHQIADGRERMLAAVVKVTGVPEAHILSPRRTAEVFSARKVIDHALHRLGWGMREIAIGAHGINDHAGIAKRLSMPLTEIEQANLVAAVKLAEQRPSKPPPITPDETVTQYVMRAAAYAVSMRPEAMFERVPSPRAMQGRAIVAWALYTMGMYFGQISRTAGTRVFSDEASRTWVENAKANPKLMAIAEEIVKDITAARKEAA